VMRIKWKDVKKNHVFDDGSVVTQRHQTHYNECYCLTYEDNGEIKTLVASKDHLIQVNISKFPEKAKRQIRELCVGQIPLREDMQCEILGYVNEEQKKLIYDYVSGNIDKSWFKEVEDISEDHFECYLFTFKDETYREVFVKRFTIKSESQKIDDDNFWIPMEGINWLVTTYGILEM